MYYEINVAKKDNKGEYRHYFATDKRSITTKKQLIETTSHFMVVFPAPEYNISVSYVPEVSFGMSAEKFIFNPDELTDKS